jgi:CRISPR-associated exonuclease Cas4
VIREVELTTRRTGDYRRALRTAESIDGPPARAANDAKCEPCEYREACGPKTRSLKSMLET